ncbi:MAG TPA: hypothetical protein VIM75_14645 [Ohtaekwangia sp.]|uniref:hypothetical protein n=1 Tax=Ohtaekwangia sp. TaxID=2066019 RepID=UPI002F92DE32
MKLHAKEFRSGNYRLDSIPVPEVNLLYNGELVTAELLRSLPLRQTQMLPIQVEMVIPKKLADSLPSLIAMPESVKVFFAKTEKAAPYSSCEYKDIVVLLMVQWSFAEPVKKGNIIGFIIHYNYTLNDRIISSGEVTKYITF